MEEHEVKLSSLRLSLDMQEAQCTNAVERVGKDWDARFKHLGQRLQEVSCDRVAAAERLEALARWAERVDQVLAECRVGPTAMSVAAIPAPGLSRACPAPTFGVGVATPRDRGPRPSPCPAQCAQPAVDRPSLDAGASSRGAIASRAP